ncbi:MAG: CapA family protein, partial [Anaerolineaceae bacterium]|nr:CapA family protein [Anaerolineaceae bacterium]
MKRIEFLILITLLISFRTVSAEEYRIYSLVCPFETVTDTVSRKELLEILSSPADAADREIKKILFTEESAHDLSGSIPGYTPVSVSGDPDAWIKKTENGVICAIIPFDQIDPSMKVIRVSHAAFPWDDAYDPGTDMLAVPSENPNYFPERMTTVLLTGTTALARTVAYKMSVNGVFYPGELIRAIFEMSDITHISNESSFWSFCPEPRRENVSIQFCSPPEALDLLDYLGVDVVELTGNHLRDYDWTPFAETLDLLEERGYAFYGAGRTPESSAEPLFLEHNGNHFAFLGCNCAGPEHVYVSENLPGVRLCDFELLEE